jgi:hypothetical protein
MAARGSTKFRTPKGCVVRRVHLVKGGAVVGMDCGGEGGGGRGSFPSHGGGTGNYPETFVRGVRSIDFRGMGVSGEGARAGFVLIPASAECRSDGHGALACKLVGDTSSSSLSGSRKR